jgi:biofilm PGA synthesis N-glycosyltransferase PgaC
MRILDIVIIVLFFIIGYCYLLYPVVLRLLATFFPKSSRIDENFRPTVSIILAVYNEELVLERCLESLLALDYPKESLEIVIGSDGSSDRTNEILASYSRQYSLIKPLYFSDRRGKMPVLNDLVTKATGEVLLFADADITLSKNTIRSQVRHYADASIGAVAGAYRIDTQGNEGLYHSEKEYAFFEQKIRSDESKFSSTTGLFGGNYTIRRELWRPLPDPLVHDDMFVICSILDQKKRVMYEPESVSIDLYSRSFNEEFRRKSRSASRGFHTLSFFPKLTRISGGKNSFLLWSHKLLRWLSPFIASAIMILSVIGLVVFGKTVYVFLLWGFVLVSFISLIGWILEKQNIRIPIIRQITWLVIMNLAYIQGTFKFLMKTDTGIWTQSTRPALTGSSLKIKEAVHTK